MTPYVFLYAIHVVFGSEINDGTPPIIFYNLATLIIFYLYLPAKMNGMYYTQINKDIIRVKAKSDDLAVQLSLLEKSWGTSSVIGWLTLIPIAGILAAVALPAYQDYTRKAQVAEGFFVGSSAAQKIGAYYASTKQGPSDLTMAGYSFAPSKAVKDVTFDGKTGVLTVSFWDGFFAAKTLVLVPSVTSGNVSWLCTSTGISTKYLPQACLATQIEGNAKLAVIDAEAINRDSNKAEYDRKLATLEIQYPQLNPDSTSYNQAALDWVVERKKMYDQGGGRTSASSLQQAVTDYATELQKSQNNQQRIESIPPVDAYIAYTRNLPRNVRFQQVFKDIGVKFPMQFGAMSFANTGFQAQHFSQATLLEETQTIAHNRTNSLNNGFILFQNRTNQSLKGIVLEVQSEERSCEDKGSVYFMNLALEKVLPPGAVTGVRFTFPPVIPTGTRCMDIVDLIF